MSRRGNAYLAFRLTCGATDPALGPLSRTMRQAFMNAVGAQKLNPEAVSSGGLTREVQQEFLAEMGGDAVDWSYSVQLFFSYSQKRA